MAFKVIVANGLRSYRQLLAHAIGAARPEAEVTMVAPALLEAKIEALKPDLVVCSCARPAEEAGVRAWVELYTDHGPESVVCVDGSRTAVRNIELEDVLRFVDRALDRERARGAEATAGGLSRTEKG